MNAEFDGIEVDGRYFAAEVDFDVEWDNDGIGAYEYWGAKCYDKGTDYAVLGDFVATIVEHLADGTEQEISESDPIYKSVLSAVESRLESHIQNLELDKDDGDYDDPRDYDPPEPDYD